MVVRLVRWLCAGALCALVAGVALRAAADTFETSSGGKVEGTLVNPTESPRQTYVIRTESGSEISLDKNQITRIVHKNPDEDEYEKIRGDYPDTAQGQWDLATWCLKHGLTQQRQTHLERVIALDPDNKEARGALNYAFVDGKWMREDERMKQQGYVMYKGVWKLPQQVELEEQKRKDDASRREWFAKLARWRKVIDNQPERLDSLSDTVNQDAAAIPALEHLFGNESNVHVKKALLKELVQMNVPSAVNVVVNATIDDPDEEVRLTALDELVAQPDHPPVTSFYVKILKDKDNVRVNRAAVCLGRLKDKSAIIPLIDALVTTHKFKEVSSAPPGQTTTTFGRGPGGSGGGGLAVGGAPKVFNVPLQNQEVLRALMTLTDGAANFQFDKAAWKSWYATQKKPATVDARRG